VIAEARELLHHEVAGAGSPLVFLHAGICDGRMWDPQWERFARDHRVVRCDLRGFGQTPLASGRFTHASDAIELLDALALGPAALVGASMGGGVALQVAVARPDLVSALVLVASGVRGHEWSSEVTKAWAEEEAAFERGDLDAAVEVNLRTWVDGPHRSAGEVDPDVRAEVGAMVRRSLELAQADPGAEEGALVEDISDRLGEIEVPALVLVGELDVADMRAIAERLARELPKARLEAIPDAAHLASMERPADFERLALGFLAEVGA
jgi:3-oxoadipate enol-lactonase